MDLQVSQDVHFRNDLEIVFSYHIVRKRKEKKKTDLNIHGGNIHGGLWKTPKSYKFYFLFLAYDSIEFVELCNQLLRKSNSSNNQYYLELY